MPSPPPPARRPRGRRRGRSWSRERDGGASRSRSRSPTPNDGGDARHNKRRRARDDSRSPPPPGPRRAATTHHRRPRGRSRSRTPPGADATRPDRRRRSRSRSRDDDRAPRGRRPHHYNSPDDDDDRRRAGHHQRGDGPPSSSPMSSSPPAPASFVAPPRPRLDARGRPSRAGLGAPTNDCRPGDGATDPAAPYDPAFEKDFNPLRRVPLFATHQTQQRRRSSSTGINNTRRVHSSTPHHSSGDFAEYDDRADGGVARPEAAAPSAEDPSAEEEAPPLLNASSLGVDYSAPSSLGWRASSGAIPARAPAIANVSDASMRVLEAETANAKTRAAREREEKKTFFGVEARRRVGSGGYNGDGGIYGDGDGNRGVRSKSKGALALKGGVGVGVMNSRWEVRNRGVGARNRADGGSTREEDPETARENALARKAALYDRLASGANAAAAAARGEEGVAVEECPVDFDAKAIEARRLARRLASESSVYDVRRSFDGGGILGGGGGLAPTAAATACFPPPFPPPPSIPPPPPAAPPRDGLEAAAREARRAKLEATKRRLVAFHEGKETRSS